MDSFRYGVSDKALTLISREDADGMVKQALAKLKYDNIKKKFEESESNIYWCRFAVKGSDEVILFVYLLDPDSEVPQMTLLTWSEAVVANLNEFAGGPHEIR